MILDFVKACGFASQAGLSSTAQLSVFLTCAQNEGALLSDIYGVVPSTPEYKRPYTMVRKLMKGAPNRNNDGLELLQWGDSLSGKERAILLTPKGRKLLKRIEHSLAGQSSLNETKQGGALKCSAGQIERDGKLSGIIEWCSYRNPA